MRVYFAIVILLALGAPAAADSCGDMKEAVETGIKSHWPDARFIVYHGPDSDAIENGLRNIGNRVSDADRNFVVISRQAWPRLRIVSFIDGCYEAFIDVDRETLDAWLSRSSG